MENKIILLGEIDQKAITRFYGLRDYNKFAEKHRGKRIIHTIEVLNDNNILAMVGYIHAVIKPKMQAAMIELGERVSEDRALEICLEMATVTQGKNKTVEQLTYNELRNFIDEIKQIAAEHYNYYIDDSINIIK